MRPGPNDSIKAMALKIPADTAPRRPFRRTLGLSIGDDTTTPGNANSLAAIGWIAGRNRFYLALVDSLITTADASASVPIRVGTMND